MKFQVGDKVIVLHSNEEGEVIDIINDDMVMVDIRGVKFPAYTDQLEYPYLKIFTENKTGQPKKAKIYIDDIRKEKNTKEERKADGVWLSFLPVMNTDEFGDEVVEYLKIHLINRTANNFQFIYQLNYFGKSEFDLKNKIVTFEDFYLHDVPFEDLNDNPVFSFEFRLTESDKKKVDFFEANLKLKAKQLFAQIEKIRKKNEATFSYKLFEEYPLKQLDNTLSFDKLSNKGVKIYDASKARQHLEPARTVVDLHIEKISDNCKRLSNFDILTIQLNTFEKYFELAYLHRLPNLIVIHGVGVGRLRNEIHDILRLKKEVKSFVNQYHPSFGYGATEIYFQYAP